MTADPNDAAFVAQAIAAGEAAAAQHQQDVRAIHDNVAGDDVAVEAPAATPDQVAPATPTHMSDIPVVSPEPTPAPVGPDPHGAVAVHGGEGPHAGHPGGGMGNAGQGGGNSGQGGGNA